MGDFTLSEDTQRFSFPAQMAHQMGTTLAQPLMEPPGISNGFGFGTWPVIVPSPIQSTVFAQSSADPPTNLSIPNLTVSDAVRLRPRQPLIDRENGHQTAVNLILGMRDIMYGVVEPLPTQLETALRLQPALTIVELGYAEVLAAAVTGSFSNMPDAQSFRDDYSKIVHELRKTGTTVVVLTVPNPADTAYFSTIQTAASLVKVAPSLLAELWRVRDDDLITAKGLNEIAFQVNAASLGPLAGDPFRELPDGSILTVKAAAELREHVQRMNHSLQQIANDEGAEICDLYSYFKRIHNTGALVGERTLTSEYLGGFYSLNGYYPGATGQALIANEVLTCLNRAFGTTYSLIRTEDVLASDPVAAYKKAEGSCWTREELTTPQPLPTHAISASQDIREKSDGAAVAESGSGGADGYALRLPDELQQILPVNSERSYFGDAISAQHCLTPETIKWGSGNNLLFGGLAMMDSHLSGNILFRFAPPVDDWTTFQISFADGLTGTESTLTAPTFYKLPGKQQTIHDVPGLVSTGRLNLRTGDVDPTPGSLNIYASFFNSALFALLRVNPDFPKTPLSFPGQYGSASARFEQRPDGKLDFTFQGSTFVPLGDGTSFPLNFCGPSRQYASIPSNGTVLHPHIALTTKESVHADQADGPHVPTNTLQEFTLFSAASSFGDLFTLNAPDTGGPALGRSRLLGRVQIQFGPRSGHSVPVAVSTSRAGGILAPLGRTPLAQLFPGQLTPGPEGFCESLRFPLQTYSLNDLAVIDDPFDISVGALDVRTGELIHPLLHRGFINQDLIFALLRVEPRTPTSSFFFKGPGGLRQGTAGDRVFEFFGEVHIPYPPGFLFPDQNLATGFAVTGGGALDPYLWLWAVSHNDSPSPDTTVAAKDAVSSRGELFSYSVTLPGAGPEGRAHFEYENHSQQGGFKMHSLAWIDRGQSTLGDKLFNSITFSCFGIWRKNGVERVVQAAAQFSQSSEVTYVGIQIGPGGEISNVNALSPPDAFPVPLKAAANAFSTVH